jgi:hypothetical protein
MPFTLGLFKACLPVLIFLVLFTGPLSAQEKVTLGTVEEVILLPWRVKLTARIDSGAATTSLHAQDLKVIDKMAEFILPTNSGELALKLPVKRWVRVKSALGHQRRPVVELDLCIGPKRVTVRTNLADRSNLKYPLLIGRNALKSDFVIDCTQNLCAPPQCPEITGK